MELVAARAGDDARRGAAGAAILGRRALREDAELGDRLDRELQRVAAVHPVDVLRAVDQVHVLLGPHAVDGVGLALPQAAAGGGDAGGQRRDAGLQQAELREVAAVERQASRPVTTRPSALVVVSTSCAPPDTDSCGRSQRVERPDADDSTFRFREGSNTLNELAAVRSPQSAARSPQSGVCSLPWPICGNVARSDRGRRIAVSLDAAPRATGLRRPHGRKQTDQERHYAEDECGGTQ